MLLYIADGIDDHRHNKESRCKPRRLVSPSNGIIAKGANKKDGHDGAGNHLKDPAHHGLAGIAQALDAHAAHIQDPQHPQTVPHAAQVKGGKVQFDGICRVKKEQAQVPAPQNHSKKAKNRTVKDADDGALVNALADAVRLAGTEVLGHKSGNSRGKGIKRCEKKELDLCSCRKGR